MTTKEDDLEQLDRDMSELTDIDAEFRKLNVKKDVLVKGIVDGYARQIDPLTARRTELVEKIGVFYQENKEMLVPEGVKTAVLRNGILSSRTSPGSLIVDDESKALAFIKRVGKLRLFTKPPSKRTLDKTALKKDPSFVDKVPGIHIDRPENLTITLARTKIEIIHKLNPLRTRLN